jgi:Rrf2 family nitric oxide-sensitive transcriptional repressor
MKLTQYTDYSLRVLMYLGFKDGPATISEIAERYDISRNHVVKVAHQLGLLGYLQTVRGKGGGLRLARPAAEINVGAVIRDMENLELVECLGENNTCVLSPPCVLRSALQDALKAFLATLDGYTLADLIDPPQKARRQKMLKVLSL